MALEAGSRLGPYEIVELRGKGGMGEVYRARDTRLDRDVAVKVLAAGLSEDPGFKKRFEREAKTISQLQHQNVCTLYDIGSEDGVDYLVMEYLEGETLADRLRKGPMPIDEVLRIGGEIAEAVDAAHQLGIVHRDLKPGNVMVTKAGAKVLDFGLAKGTERVDSGPDEVTKSVAQALTVEGKLVGTMPYMAPELLEGKPASEQSDIWALGCILYEMATRERPFRGETQASLISSIMAADPEPPSQRQPLTPDRLDQITKRCLEKDPTARWKSCGDFRASLLSIDAGSAPPRRSPVSSPSRPVLIVLAAALVVGLAAVGFWFRPTRTEAPVAEIANAQMELIDERKLGVLPLEALTPGPEMEQLARGITERVITGLSGVLPVASRRASFSHEGQDACIAAADMGVRYVLEGSVQKAGDRVRASARVIDCPSGDPIWGEEFDRDFDDPLAAQDQLGSWILNPAALEVFARRSGASYTKFGEQFFTITASLRGGEREWGPDVIAELQGVVDGCISEAPRYFFCHQAAGHLAEYTGERERAINYMKKSAELGKGVSWAVAWHGRTLAIAGQSQEAIDRLETAMSLVSAPWGLWMESMARAHFAASDYDAAIDWAQQAVDTRFSVASSNLVLAASYALADRSELARAAMKESKAAFNYSSAWIEREYSIADPEHRARYMEGLRMAGLED